MSFCQDLSVAYIVLTHVFALSYLFVVERRASFVRHSVLSVQCLEKSGFVICERG